MKIRIEDNSIRLRLRRSEVEHLGSTGSLYANTIMPGGRFEYALVLNDAIDVLTALKTKDGIRMELPQAEGESWVNSEQVGFERELPLGDGQTLRLLVEKDFVCLDRNPRSQQDQYPNPKAGMI